jgi:DNA recombination protein RmuC
MQLLYPLFTLIGGFIMAWLIAARLKQAETKFIVEANLQLKADLEIKQEQIKELTAKLATSHANETNLHHRLSEQKLEIANMKQQFTLEFENLANRIFEEKAVKFSQQNQLNLSSLLNPLGEKIKDFERKVEEVYNLEGKERATLKEQIRALTELNQQMSTETKNLTLALKGDSKTQGNWGEMILESILQKSGLVKNREYMLQVSLSTEIGKRYQPDVIVNLPDNKVLIIDSKVSLTAYERFISSEDDGGRNLARKEHALSFKNHIKNLSAKNYQSLYQIKSLDFVLMFIPIESAFALAIQDNNELFEEALSNNIVLVCPTTLLATMRTVASLWRSEKSAQNAHEIARIGGELYDRLVGFLDSMELVDGAIRNTHNKYHDALTKLNGNKGIIKSAAKLKDLGARTNKILEEKWG